MQAEAGDSGGGGTVRPKAEARGGTYNIRGVDVQFPFEPYAAQMAFMNKVMATFHGAHGHTHTRKHRHTQHTDTQTHTHTHTHTHRRLHWLEEEKSHQQRRGWAF